MNNLTYIKNAAWYIANPLYYSKAHFGELCKRTQLSVKGIKEQKQYNFEHFYMTISSKCRTTALLYILYVTDY